MKTLALSTAVLALVSGAALAQTAPESSNPTTGTGAEQAPMAGRDASPTAPSQGTGDMGGEPAINSQTDGTTPDATMPEAGMPDTGTAAPDTGSAMTESTAPMTPPEGYEPVMTEQVTSEMLMDVTVYDSEESSVGDISAVMPETGMPEQVIVDVGGFLGIGAKPVALNVSELTVFKQTDGEEVRAYTMMTEDEIEALPEHEG